MKISINFVHMKWKKYTFSVRDICLFTFLLVCFSIDPWDIKIKLKKKKTCFWVSILLLCRTQIIFVQANTKWQCNLHCRIFWQMCSFNRCLLLLKSQRFHPLCLIYPSQALTTWPLYHTLWALYNTLLKYSYFPKQSQLQNGIKLLRALSRWVFNISQGCTTSLHHLY